MFTLYTQVLLLAVCIIVLVWLFLHSVYYILYIYDFVFVMYILVYIVFVYILCV